jgi:hypothetical protein
MLSKIISPSSAVFMTVPDDYPISSLSQPVHKLSNLKT